MKNKSIIFLLASATLWGCSNTSSVESITSVENSSETTTSETVISSSEEIISSEESSSVLFSSFAGEYVTDYVLDAERKYTGYMVDGKPEGQGVLTWIYTNCVYTGEFKNGLYHGQGLFEWRNDGNQFQGEFRNNEPYYGKFTYENTMNYTGYMSNWTFHGQGRFDWNTYYPNGSIKTTGWLYEGEFKNGTMAGCVGKLTFDQTDSLEGFVWFEGLMDGFPSFKKNANGRGKVRYGDKSTYVGDLLIDASGTPLRVGKGEQEFTKCYLDGINVGGPSGTRVIKYRGQFDARESGWFFGNGIFFVGGNDLVMTGYLEGNWASYVREGEWVGTFDKSEELEQAEMNLTRFEYRPSEASVLDYLNQYATKTSTDVLFMGDSYMDMWQTKWGVAGDYNYEELTKSMDCMNVAIGGTTTGQWNSTFFNRLTASVTTANKVVVHLGLNDCHIGLQEHTAEEDIVTLVGLIKAKYSAATIYLITPEPSVAFISSWAAKDKYLVQFIRNYCAQTANVECIDTAALFFTGDDAAPANPAYYINDNLHLNEAGYQIWTGAILDAIA